MKNIILITIILFSSLAKAQSFDSTSYYNLLDKYESYSKKNIEDSTALAYSELAPYLKIVTKEHLAKWYLTQIRVNWSKNLDNSQLYLLKSLKIYKELNDTVKVSGLYNNLGIVSRKKGRYQEALNYYTMSAKLKAELKDSLSFAKTLNNIGVIYWNQKNHVKSMEYAHKSLKIKLLINDTSGVSQSYNNIGVEFSEMHQFDSALVYYKKSLDIRKTTGNPYFLAEILSNIGSVFIQKYDTVSQDISLLDSAEFYYQNTKIITDTIEYPYVELYTLNGLGNIYNRRGEYKLAQQYFQLAYERAKAEGYKKELMDATNGIYEVSKRTNQPSLALKYFEEFHQLYVELFNEENSSELASLESKYAYEAQKTIDSLKFEQIQHVQKAEFDKKIQYQKIVTICVGVVLVLIIVFAILLAKRLKISKEQKIIIEETNEELNQINEEILAQRDEIEEQKLIVENKNHAITSSINYAKRIQEAILPPADSLNKYLKNGFVLYQPKDVVAGDFYWLESIGDTIFFAVADCTGHGVPGAMVSVVCNNALNRCIREYKLTKPSDILDKTRELVITTFAKSERQVKDGMDIALCAWNQKTNNFEYAGANNPLYIIKNNSIEIIKADKEAIGYVENSTPFTNHSINLSEIDKIYLFTDGYADQFGGPKNKKLGYKKFRDKLIDINEGSMDEQHTMLSSFFAEWQGNEEQVDDVCVIGIKI